MLPETYSLTITPLVSVIIAVAIVIWSALQLYSQILEQRLEQARREEKKLLSELVKALRESADLQRGNLTGADRVFLFKQSEDAARWRTIRHCGAATLFGQNGKNQRTNLFVIQ